MNVLLVAGCLPPVNVLRLAIAAELLIMNIRNMRPELDLEPIMAWAKEQAAINTERDTLSFLADAADVVMRGDILPWLADSKSDSGDQP